MPATVVLEYRHNDPQVQQDCPFAEISFRALSLAKSGRFTCWEEIAATIEGENCPGARRRIGDNAEFCEVLNSRCRTARRATLVATD